MSEQFHVPEWVITGIQAIVVGAFLAREMNETDNSDNPPVFVDFFILNEQHTKVIESS